MKTKKILFYLLAGVLGGCVPVMSLHPLYTEGDVVFEKKLLGVWVDDPNEPDTTWEFKCPNESEKKYELIFSDKEGKKGSFDVHLVKLENLLFLDIYPNKSPCKEQDSEKMEWPYNAFFLVPVHTLIKIDSISPQLKMRLTDDDEMEKLLKEDPNVVKHESLADGFVLTAPTEQLQKFVLKYADDSRVFTDEKVLIRRKTKCSKRPPEKSPDKACDAGTKASR
ncbi:MAG: hypothetical protein ACYS83_10280 [Planctomycetota bacterium]|jgi:hypothetical protein